MATPQRELIEASIEQLERLSICLALGEHSGGESQQRISREILLSIRVLLPRLQAARETAWSALALRRDCPHCED